MNTIADLIKDFRDRLEYNSRQFDDEKIVCSFNNEYEYLQKLMQKNECPDISCEQKFQFTNVGPEFTIPENLNITSVEYSLDGEKWTKLHRNCYEDFVDYKSCDSKCETRCPCDGPKGVTQTLAEDSNPTSFIQTYNTLTIVPFPTDETVDVCVYANQYHKLTVDNLDETPYKIDGFHQLLTLASAKTLGVRCLSEAAYTRLEREYNLKYQEFKDCIETMGDVVYMKARPSSGCCGSGIKLSSKPCQS